MGISMLCICLSKTLFLDFIKYNTLVKSWERLCSPMTVLLLRVERKYLLEYLFGKGREYKIFYVRIVIKPLSNS